MQKKLTEHVPVVNWRNRHIIISIVGCGGTGSQIATGMPYLHQALLGRRTSLRIAGVPDRWRPDHGDATACGNHSAARRSGCTRLWC